MACQETNSDNAHFELGELGGDDAEDGVLVWWGVEQGLETACAGGVSYSR
jgi:hypothetical protein